MKTKTTIAEHTPGPWTSTRLDFGNDRSKDQFSIRQCPFAAVEDTNTRKTLEIARVEAENGEANARLIASAPALLEVSRDVQRYFAALDEMQPTRNRGTEGARIRVAVNAAIAKATGQNVVDDQREFDNARAFAEGWGLFNDGEIQRLDEGLIVAGQEPSGEPVFESDRAALAFIQQRADAGSAYHQAALRLLKEGGL